MKRYKVIALSVGSKGKRIFNAGEEVDEDAFIEGHATELVKEGFLEEITEKDAGTDGPPPPPGESDKNKLNKKK